VIVAGFGCRDGAAIASFKDALALAAGSRALDALAVPADRAHLLEPLADELGLPLVMLERSQLAGIITPTLSKASLSRRGTGSVAEAAALAAAGPDAWIVVPRRIGFDRMTTCAIAQGDRR
jgi:cobalt-precorrin 5A hydrolase